MEAVDITTDLICAINWFESNNFIDGRINDKSNCSHPQSKTVSA